MFVIKCSIFCLTVGVMMGRIACLVELPQVEDNDIKQTELVVRTTTNTLFSTLKLQSKKRRPRLQYFTLVHHYLTSLTLQDYTTLREIAKLTRVDKNAINNRTQDFITALTEILDDESNNLEMANITKSDGLDEADRFIEEYMKELEQKLNHSNYSYDTDIEIVKLMMIQESLKNATNTIQAELDVWKPSPLDSLRSGRRIFRGRGTKIKYYPFMASVQIFNKFMCGASIIKSDLVITAASCLQLAYNNRLYRENPAFLTVRVGSSYYEGTGEKISVIEVYFHPNYDPRKLHSNIAVMRLHRKISFKDKYVKKIEIDRESSPLPAVTDGILVLGWGARSENNKLYNSGENKLASAVLDFYPLEECREVYSKEYVTRFNFCAGFLSKGGGACNRDVGGPGVVAGVLVGIISFGSPICGAPDAPTVFTKVGYYSEWIDQIMEQDVPQRDIMTTLLPRTKSQMNYESAQYRQNVFQVTPVLEGVTPFNLMAMNHQTIERTYTTRKDQQAIKTFLKTMYDSRDIEDYFASRIPAVSTEVKKVPSRTGTVRSFTSSAFKLTTSSTLSDDIEDRIFKLGTEISDKLFTPEPNEYSSIEKFVPNNTSTTVDAGSVEVEKSEATDEISSNEEKVEMAPEAYPKDISQETVLKNKPSQGKTPWKNKKSSEGKNHLQDKKSSQGKKTSKDKKPSRDEKSLHNMKPSAVKKPWQDVKPSQAKQTSYVKKPSRDKTSLQGKQPLKGMEPLKNMRPSQDMRPSLGKKLSALNLQQTSTLTSLDLPQEISQLDTLSKVEDGKYLEEKYSSKEKYAEVVNESGSGSESDSDTVAIPLEIETVATTKKPAPKYLRDTTDTATQEEMLELLMSNTTYPTEKQYSDSEQIEQQLSYAPTLVKKAQKDNESNIDETILTLLYLSENEKDNDINSLLDNTTLTLIEDDFASREDISIRTKSKKNLSFRSNKKNADSNKLSVNDEIGTNILFNLLKEAVDNDIIRDNRKKMP